MESNNRNEIRLFTEFIIEFLRYYRVKLLVNATTGEAVAMKVIDLKKHANAADTVKKEVCVHRMLNDPHIIRFYGRRENGNFEFIFLEYASGGELFDRIGIVLKLRKLIF